MVQAGQCADSSLSAVPLHSGEKLLLAQDFDPAASGCRLDLARLQNAGERIAAAMEQGADLVIINRFGKRERNGTNARRGRGGEGRMGLSRIARLDQRTALPDQCLHSAETDVRPLRRKVRV